MMKKIDEAVENFKRVDDIFKCPLCGREMKIIGKSLICENKHCFDISKQGYINFLTRSSNNDYDKEMLESRNIICKCGFFDPILKGVSDFISNKISSNNDPKYFILDAGCGEGSHLNKIINNLHEDTKREFNGIGIDISKDGIHIASREYEKQMWCVADLAKLPFMNNQFDFILNIFSPSNYLEFKRILKDKGSVIKVVPEGGYLKELRNAFYDGEDKRNYSNEKVVNHFIENFKIINRQRITYNFTLENQNIGHLIKMTPLSWSAGNEKIEKVLSMNINSFTVDVSIIEGSIY
ncbi:MAG TPA: SAM-dependent methyltransferase [Clostridiaceae bacterium]|jgi:23S rRNA (guanine745-N1)-methyltransferase|nr:SAM-dependent methyltransferase [Clostridiaceae bacterium]HBF77956.1 SAM-dependent methyltransferase [Clostridiaceae bacterium]HBG38316.1 SAM-dependent methyltransferase [Clostridiaceae bacterium]HBN28538.1 SAM-dependent methyltransferase [Clostridiaceae bacterium]